MIKYNDSSGTPHHPLGFGPKYFHTGHHTATQTVFSENDSDNEIGIDAT